MEKTFEEIALLWREDKRQFVKTSTYAAYCLLLRVHILPALGEKMDVREEDVQALVNDRLARGLG